MAIYRPCPNRVTCPATVLLPGMGVIEDPDSPLMNLSSEAPDPINFLAVDYSIQTPPPESPWQWWQDPGGFGGGSSTISQNDANDTATNFNQNGSWDNWDSNPTQPGGPGVGPQRQKPTIYQSAAQTCGVPCTGGGTFEYTLPAGTVQSINSQEEADEKAASICEERAGVNPLCFITDTLPGECKDAEYSQFVQVGGGTPFTGQVPSYSYLYSIVGGALPTGLTLDVYTGEIYGTPTTTGNYTFTVRAVDSAFNVVDKDFSIVIIEVTSDRLLGGVVSSAYSQSLIGDIPAGFTGTWEVTAGFLPTGLTLDPATGAITGTPTVKGTYTFQVTLTATN